MALGKGWAELKGQEDNVNSASVNQGRGRRKLAAWPQAHTTVPAGGGHPAPLGFQSGSNYMLLLPAPGQKFHKYFHPEFNRVGIFHSAKERSQRLWPECIKWRWKNNVWIFLQKKETTTNNLEILNRTAIQGSCWNYLTECKTEWGIFPELQLWSHCYWKKESGWQGIAVLGL